MKQIFDARNTVKKSLYFTAARYISHGLLVREFFPQESGYLRILLDMTGHFDIVTADYGEAQKSATLRRNMQTEEDPIRIYQPDP